MKIGILFQPWALWIGAHWSDYNQRWCVNVLPCITIWIALSGGNIPRKSKIYFVI
jgi:hypothetical protein